MSARKINVLIKKRKTVMRHSLKFFFLGLSLVMPLFICSLRKNEALDKAISQAEVELKKHAALSTSDSRHLAEYIEYAVSLCIPSSNTLSELEGELTPASLRLYKEIKKIGQPFEKKLDRRFTDRIRLTRSGKIFYDSIIEKLRR